MPVVVVYESMYGNTRAIAEAIAEGLNPADAVVVPVGQASPQVVTPADLVVVGGPTHMFGMSRPKSRQVAVDTACKPESGLTLEPEAQGTGLREWFDALDAPGGKAAAFDTRIKGPLLIGHASRGIRGLLRQH